MLAEQKRSCVAAFALHHVQTASRLRLVWCTSASLIETEEVSHGLDAVGLILARALMVNGKVAAQCWIECAPIPSPG